MRKRSLEYVDVPDFLAALGIRNISQSGSECDFSCPSGNHSNGDQSPSARMNTRNTLWICHGCGLRGDAVDFLMMAKNLDESTAQRVIDERYGGPELSVEAGGLRAEVERIFAGTEEEEIARVPPGEEWLEKFHIRWDDNYLPLWDGTPFRYMFDRGFSISVLNEWSIGWDDISERITIPVRDRFGELVGFKGRSSDPNVHPKYLILGDAPGREPRYGFDTYAKSQFVFGLDRALVDRAVLVEGELNAIALHQAGEEGGVAVSGSEFSKRQATQIIQSFSSAVIYFDGDDAGRHGTQKVLDALEQYMPVSIVVDPPDDAAALGPDALELIAGAKSSLQVSIN